MIRAFALLVGVFLPVLVLAQDGKPTPLVQADFEATSAVPGQPVVVRLKVLVPTWMPKPPIMPTYDLPNLMVRDDGRAATSISERIDGETWSGISRKYLLYPLIAGRIDIPAQTVVIYYADPGTREPIEFRATVEAASLTGEVPEGAAGLDPFIAATGLEIEQAFEGDPANLDPGDALVRRITVRIKGASPMLLPQLADPKSEPGLSVYADEPVLDEAQERGVLSGSRIERITLVPETGGRFARPAVTLRWFNLDSGQVETAEVEGFEMTVRGPPPAAKTDSDWRQSVTGWAPVILGVAALLFASWRLWPRIARWRRARRVAYRASEDYAYRRAVQQLEARQLDGAFRAITRWWQLASAGSRELPEPLAAALASIGAGRYGRPDARTPDPDPWSGARRALDGARKEILRSADDRRHDPLPPINPVAAAGGIR